MPSSPPYYLLDSSSHSLDTSFKPFRSALQGFGELSEHKVDLRCQPEALRL